MRRERTTPGTGANAARVRQQARLRDEAADERATKGQAAILTWGLRNQDHRDLLTVTLAEPKLHPSDRERMTQWLAWLVANHDRSLMDWQRRVVRRALRQAVAVRMKGCEVLHPLIAPPRLAPFLTDPSLLPKAPPGRHA